jgi:hypothetical protein
MKDEKISAVSEFDSVCSLWGNLFKENMEKMPAL